MSVNFQTLYPTMMVDRRIIAAIAIDNKMAALGIAILLIPRGTIGCSISSAVSEIQGPVTTPTQ
jgi:hypothetical protein